MTKPAISGIAPFFIVKNVPAALSFHCDRLGFDITFQGPHSDDIFFGIVQRGAAMILLKDVGVDPLPNYKRDVKQGWARWDAYLHVPDPDALAAEFSSRNVEFSQPLKNDDDGLRGFEIKDTDGYVLFFGRPGSEGNTGAIGMAPIHLLGWILGFVGVPGALVGVAYPTLLLLALMAKPNLGAPTYSDGGPARIGLRLPSDHTKQRTVLSLAYVAIGT